MQRCLKQWMFLQRDFRTPSSNLSSDKYCVILDNLISLSLDFYMWKVGIKVVLQWELEFTHTHTHTIYMSSLQHSPVDETLCELQLDVHNNMWTSPQPHYPHYTGIICSCSLLLPTLWANKGRNYVSFNSVTSGSNTHLAYSKNQSTATYMW